MPQRRWVAAAATSTRLAKTEDLGSILTLINWAYEGERRFLPRPRITRAELTAEFRDPAKVILVLEERGGRLLGTVRVDFTSTEERGAFPMLGLLAVDPEQRGHGFGVALVRAAEGLASEAGHGGIDLECMEEMGLPAFYARLGYEETNREFGPRWGSILPFTLVRMGRRLGEAAPSGGFRDRGTRGAG
jgi:predicted N-acetyltransferase YhbS